MPGAQRPWTWWQAKFNQIDCYSHLPSTRPADVRRAIDVLFAGVTDMPPFWAKQFEVFKNRGS